MVYCSRCGQKHQDSERCCGNCGAALAPPSTLPPLTPQVVAELKRLLEEGRKIEAIKRYRVETGADLKAAKDAVEAFGIVPAGSGRPGCLSALLLVALGLAGGWVVGWLV